MGTAHCINVAANGEPDALVVTDFVEEDAPSIESCPVGGPLMRKAQQERTKILIQDYDEYRRQHKIKVHDGVLRPDPDEVARHTCPLVRAAETVGTCPIVRAAQMDGWCQPRRHYSGMEEYPASTRHESEASSDIEFRTLQRDPSVDGIPPAPDF